MAVAIDNIFDAQNFTEAEELNQNKPSEVVDLEKIFLDPTNVDPELLWRAEAVIEYFLSLERVVPLYGNFVPQYPRRPTSGRKLTPRDFGIKDESSGSGGSTAKGLRGEEQMKDKAINQFQKTGKYK